MPPRCGTSRRVSSQFNGCRAAIRTDGDMLDGAVPDGATLLRCQAGSKKPSLCLLSLHSRRSRHSRSVVPVPLPRPENSDSAAAVPILGLTVRRENETSMLEWLTSVRARLMTPTFQRVFLAVAVPAVAVVAFVGFRDLAATDASFDFRMLAIAAVLVIPIGQIVSGLEFQLSASVVGTKVGLVEAVRVATIGSATNLLPLPGSPLVRIAAIKKGGAPTGRASGITVAIGATWLGLGFALAGIGLVTANITLIGGLAAGAGVVITSLSLTAVAHLSRSNTVIVLVRVLVIEAVLVAVGALRMWLILKGIGYAASVPDALFLEVSNILATVAGFAPGGVGLRELMAGLTAPLVGIPVTTAVLAAAVNSVMWMAMLAAMAGGLSALPGRSRSGEPRSDVADTTRGNPS